jgi:Plavaka transposase
MLCQVLSLRLSFSTAKELRGRAELLPAGPKWSCTPWSTVYPTKTPVHLFHRDSLECIQSILHSPHIVDHVHYSPLRVFKTAEKLVRVYSEWRTGDVAWDMQVCISAFSPGEFN